MTSFAIDRISRGRKVLMRESSERTYVVTGDNGSGKSRLLYDIACSFNADNSGGSDGHSVRSTGRPNYIISYSMTPFAKFDSDMVKKTLPHVEHIGVQSGSARHSLLFQAAVEFAKMGQDTETFATITENLGFSPYFAIAFTIDRVRALARLNDSTAAIRAPVGTKRLLSGYGSSVIIIEPGRVRLSMGKVNAHGKKLQRETIERDALTLDALLYLRRIGALRVGSIKLKKANDWTDADSLSSGQIAFFIGLILLTAMVKDNTLVLVDEPEISLHPAWQRVFCKTLSAVLAMRKGCYAFVATHSPIVVAAMQEDGADTITLGDIAFSNLADRGAEGELHVQSIEEVLATHFNTITPNSYLVKKSIIRAVQALRDHQIKAFHTEIELLKIAKAQTSGTVKVAIDELIGISTDDFT